MLDSNLVIDGFFFSGDGNLGSGSCSSSALIFALFSASAAACSPSSPKCTSFSTVNTIRMPTAICVCGMARADCDLALLCSLSQMQHVKRQKYPDESLCVFPRCSLKAAVKWVRT